MTHLLLVQLGHPVELAQHLAAHLAALPALPLHGKIRERLPQVGLHIVEAHVADPPEEVRAVFLLS